MTAPLDLAEAEVLIVRHLGASPRADHSRFVGQLMIWLAQRWGGDVVTWRLTGLVHDLDHAATVTAPSRHGPTAAEWLAGRLPDDALQAIASHDHRSGIESTSPLADALKVADALAVMDKSAGRDETISALQSGPAELVHVAGKRDYLATMLQTFTKRLGIVPGDLADALCGLPRQDSALL